MSKAIAVVEDDESIREMLRYYFQSVGYAVRAYESGEALFAGEEGLGLPALYILDIMLPGMDGWRFSAACGRGGTLPTYP